MKIVLTTGVFDLLHPGHLHHLIESRRIGDMLIVAVTADGHVNKGEQRPVFNVDERMAMLRAFRFVDSVMCNDWPTPENMIRYVRPNVYTKGSEYEGRLLAVEMAALTDCGANIVFTGAKLFNSSDWVRKCELL